MKQLLFLAALSATSIIGLVDFSILPYALGLIAIVFVSTNQKAKTFLRNLRELIIG